MNPDEELVAKRIYEAIQSAMHDSDRSKQASAHQFGISDLGFCSERVRRALDRQVPEDTDMLAAFIGTALGDHMERAICATWPSAMAQQTVSVGMLGDSYQYRLTGHPDLVIPSDNLVLDGKTDYGLADVERNGANQQQRFQRHLYGVGAFEGGLFPGAKTPQDVKVGNFWLDRAGKDKRVHVEIEALDLDVVDEATRWLDDVVYAFMNEEEARKEPPREMCAVVCGFYHVCRAYDTDVEGLITDDQQVRNVAMYAEGRDLEREGKRLKDQAKVHLEGVSGFTDAFTVRWTHVNPSDVPGYTRKGYDMLDIKPLKKAKS